LVRQVYQDHDYSTLPDAAFDAVTLLDVAEHVIDPLILMRTAYRVLRPDGVLYIHTPVVTRTDRLMHMLQRVPLLAGVGRIWQGGRTSIFHLQNYTASSLEALLRRAGFEQAEVRVVNELSWPVSRYIHVFVLKRLRLPGALAPLFAPFFYPLLRSQLLNANKAIATARKAPTPAAESVASK
jgi:SAM-dependent methyltransferase